MKRGVRNVKGVAERADTAVVLVARKNLLDLLNRLKKFADKAAARPDAERYLMANFGVLLNVRQLRNALADIVQTASDDDVARLERVLDAAFYLGSFFPNPLWKARLEKRRTASATKRKQEEKAKVGHLVRQWRAEGIKRVDKIQEKLAALAIKRSPSSIYGYLKQKGRTKK
jgi:hypothetical protein